MIIRRVLCPAILLAAPVLMFAQAGASTDQQKKVECRIEGQILSLISGEPVRKADVFLTAGKPGASNHSAVSDAEGKFSIEGLEPGRYGLSAQRQGYVRQNYGARRPAGPGTILSLNESQALKGLVIKLIPQGVISGRVIDEEGEALSGVSVQALHYRYMRGRRRLVPFAAAVTTNDLGQYRVPNLQPGRYYVAASSLRNTKLNADPTNASSAAQGYVPIYYANSTDASAAVAIDVAPGAEVGGIDLELLKARVFHARGKIINGSTGAPMSSSVLMLFRKEPGGMSPVPVTMGAVQSAGGTFELSNVPRGSYTVVALSSDPQDPMLTMTSVEVADDDIDNLVITLGAGHDVPVAAVVEGEKTSVDLSTVRLTLVGEDNPMALPIAGQLDKDKKGQLKRVAPEKYRLVVTGLPKGTYLKSAQLDHSDVLALGLDLRQHSGTLELVFSPTAGEITGMARTEKGEPVPGAIVTLVPKDPKRRPDLFRTIATDQNGNIHLSSVIPGEYKLYGWEDIEVGAIEDEEMQKTFDSNSVEVKIAAGASQSIQLTVIPRDAVEGEKAKR
jgi:hypothetical protein